MNWKPLFESLPSEIYGEIPYGFVARLALGEALPMELGQFS